VMVPIHSMEQARILGKIGSILARDKNGEVFALNVAKVPPQLTLADGRYFLREGRPFLEKVIAMAREREVPVHTMIRLGRDVEPAIRKTVLESAADVMVMGWPGYTGTSDRLFGSVIDPLVDNPPCDIVLVRFREERPIKSILVPVSGGPNSRRAVKLAVSMARQADDGPARVHIISIIPANATQNWRIRAQQSVESSKEGSRDYLENITSELVEGQRIADSILSAAKGHDLIVMGATEEPLLKNRLTGSISAQVAKNSPITVMIVKRRSGVIRSVLRQTVLAPSTGSAANGMSEVPEAKVLTEPGTPVDTD
jgi:nucleotide-binding universal stress UspA family protein